MRKLMHIAKEVYATWPKPNYAAKPYLEAMLELSTIEGYYGADTGRSIVAYFLSNARTWRGADAKRIKAELNKALKTAPKYTPPDTFPFKL